MSNFCRILSAERIIIQGTREVSGKEHTAVVEKEKHCRFVYLMLLVMVTFNNNNNNKYYENRNKISQHRIEWMGMLVLWYVLQIYPAKNIIRFLGQLPFINLNNFSPSWSPPGGGTTNLKPPLSGKNVLNLCFRSYSWTVHKGYIGQLKHINLPL